MANVTSVLTSHVLWQQAAVGDTAISYPANEFRWLINANWNAAVVINYGDFAIAQRSAGANFSVDIAPGMAIVGATAGDEKYIVRLGSTVNVSVTTMNTNPAALRTHKVYLAVYDKLYAGASYNAQIFIGEDTGSGAPTPTGSPVGYILLGTFTITTSQASIQTANIANTPTYADHSPPWQTYTGAMASGYAASSLAWRRVGDLVYWRGSITKSSWPNAETLIIGTLTPSATWPAQDAWMTIAASGSGIDDQARVRITAAGALYITVAGPGSGTNNCYLDGICYSAV